MDRGKPLLAVYIGSKSPSRITYYIKTLKYLGQSSQSNAFN